MVCGGRKHGNQQSLHRVVSVKILGPSLIPYWCWTLALHGCLILALLLAEVTLCAKGLHPLIIYRNDGCL